MTITKACGRAQDAGVCICSGKKVLGYLGHALDGPQHDQQGHSEVGGPRGEEGEEGGDEQAGAQHPLCSENPRQVPAWDQGQDYPVADGAEDDALGLGAPFVHRALGRSEKENPLPRKSTPQPELRGFGGTLLSNSKLGLSLFFIQLQHSTFSK